MSIDVGKYRHYVEIREPSRNKDTGGGWSDSWTPIDVDRNWWCSIENATTRAMERVAGGGSVVISSATRILEGRYHAGITTGLQIVEGGRVFNVTAVDNVNSEGEVTRVIADESIAPADVPVNETWIQDGWVQ